MRSPAAGRVVQGASGASGTAVPEEVRPLRTLRRTPVFLRCLANAERLSPNEYPPPHRHTHTDLPACAVGRRACVHRRPAAALRRGAGASGGAAAGSSRRTAASKMDPDAKPPAAAKPAPNLQKPAAAGKPRPKCSWPQVNTRDTRDLEREILRRQKNLHRKPEPDNRGQRRPEGQEELM